MLREKLKMLKQKTSPQRPGVVAHAYMPALRRLRQENCCDFQARLGYTVSSKQA